MRETLYVVLHYVLKHYMWSKSTNLQGLSKRAEYRDHMCYYALEQLPQLKENGTHTMVPGMCYHLISMNSTIKTTL